MAAAKDQLENAVSEDALARAFAGRHAEEFAYCNTRGVWFRCQRGIWLPDEHRRAMDAARHICREFGVSAKFQRASVAKAILEFASADPIFSRVSSDWDCDPMLLGTPSGVVDLRTGALCEPDPQLMISRSSSVAPASGDPEQWLAFLREATCGDHELISYLQIVMGYALTGDTSEHKLFFIYGAGGNGKGVFLHTLTKILGTYAMPTPMETFTASRMERHPVELAVLQGARLVTAAETEQGRAWAESRIKQMTGGDAISARHLYGKPFEYAPCFKIVITGNHEPQLRNVDDAMRRRFNIIPFQHKPTKPDPLLEARLQCEHGQILRWAIEGCLRWKADGLRAPAIVKRHTDQYFEEQDFFGQWIDERCERGSDHVETTAALYADYRKFAEHAGLRAMSGTAFGSELRKRHFRDWRSPGRSRARGYQGLRLVQADALNVDEPTSIAEDEEAMVRP